jgi:D-tyrosyl-tRNA(Tyr) deacylase
MRVLIQRVKWASVTVEGEEVGRIGHGYLLLIGFGREDLDNPDAILETMAQKIMNLRIMRDSEDRMNCSLRDTDGSILAVSQFTLHADCLKGRRPGFGNAAPSDQAQALFDRFIEILRKTGTPVETGCFGAMMEVSLLNDGPVTVWLDSLELFSR